jgi:hypothetical protein
VPQLPKMGLDMIKRSSKGFQTEKNWYCMIFNGLNMFPPKKGKQHKKTHKNTIFHEENRLDMSPAMTRA